MQVCETENRLSDCLAKLTTNVRSAEKWLGEVPGRTDASVSLRFVMDGDYWLTSRRNSDDTIEICIVDADDLGEPSEYTPLRKFSHEMRVRLCQLIPALLCEANEPSLQEPLAESAMETANAIEQRVEELNG